MWYVIGTACIISHPARAVKVQKKDAGIFRHRCFLTAGGKSEPTAAYPLHAAAAFDHADRSQYQHAADRQIKQAHGERTLFAHGAGCVALPAALLIACGALRLTAPAASEFSVLPAFLRTALPGAGSCAGASGCRAARGVEIRDELLLHAVLHAQCRRPESPQRLCAGGGNRQAGENRQIEKSPVRNAVPQGAVVSDSYELFIKITPGTCQKQQAPGIACAGRTGIIPPALREKCAIFTCRTCPFSFCSA